MSGGFNPSYFDELAKLEAGHFWFRGRNRIIVWAIESYFPELRYFLEIGCGTGFVLTSIAKAFPHAKLYGSEYFEQGLAYAQKRIPCAKFMQMDARQIGFESEFEAIGIFDVLEHIAEDTDVLRQIHKALNPSGYLFVTVPQHRWLWSDFDEQSYHVRRYTATELVRKVTEAGFEIVRSTSFVSTLLPAMYLSRLLRQKQSAKEIDAMSGLRINPVLNFIFEKILALEHGLIRLGISFPIGGSRLLVARKLNLQE